MQFLCAPDSFKGSLDAAQAAAAMAAGIRSIVPDASIDLCPIADGGEGTLEALVEATAGSYHEAEVMGPLGDTIPSLFGMLGAKSEYPAGSTAVVEMAAASGLTLVDEAKRNAELSTSYGTGQLMQAAIQAGAQRIILGLGGSATNDGGCGAAQALGTTFFDKQGECMAAGISGGQLQQIARIEVSPLAGVEVILACDVNNPLLGAHGASQTYGPQKGASPTQVQNLEAGLQHLDQLFREQLQQEVAQVPGAGAAGGMAAGMLAMYAANLQSGIQTVLKAVNFQQRIQGMQLCFTGEGRLDQQSLQGKACMGVAKAAKEAGVPTVALVGSVGKGAEACLEAGLDDYYIIGEGLPQKDSMLKAAPLIAQAARAVIEESF